jgi:hypothetical protein
MSPPKIKTHRQTLMDQAIAERERLRNWLLPHMANGKPKAFTKDQYRQLATADLGTFSKAAFDDAWIAAIEDSGRQDWYEPLPRRRMASQ